MPLLEAERYAAAIPVFVDYMGGYPGDLDVRREFALTLVAAGRADEAVPILEGLLEYGADPVLRLLLARTLRDERHVSEASVHYAILVNGDPEDDSLTLEWAQALAWVESYGVAEEVLLAGLEHTPDSVPLRVELARIYYYTDRLEDSGEILSGMTATELAEANGLVLRDDVLAALAPLPEPEPEPIPPPTLLERAVGAREDGEPDRAAALFAEALAAKPDDVETWQAYADFLQYELDDFDGALAALGEVERLRGEADSTLQYRMAQLEVWTDRLDDARLRLEALLALLDAEATAAEEPAAPSEEPGGEADPTSEAEPVTKADVHALLGDLRRWSGDRLPAVKRYELALAEDPDHPSALEGLAILRAEVARMMLEVERPRIGAIASSLSDTDDFMRIDLGGEWYGLRTDWVWGMRTGGRVLEGLDLTGAQTDERGVFADFEGARWWRWGTIRTGAHFGVQNIRSNNLDVAFGASARFMGGGGTRTDVGFDHEPAYALTNTLQSVFAQVYQDRLTASHSRPVGESWSLAATAEAASLDPRGVAGTTRNLRLQGALSVGRAMSRTFTLGLSARVLRYRDAAPDASGFPLYWDPNSSVSLGPYAEYAKPLSTFWEFRARINPGFALIDERRTTGSETVPDVSGSIAFTREGAGYRTSIGLFYGQGRFDGYRSFGMSLSFSARGGLGRGRDE